MFSIFRFSTRQQRINNIITQNFTPFHLDIINESRNHSVPKDSETHFKVTIVSDKFQGLTSIQRQRNVLNLLREEFNAGLHAFSVFCRTPEEWEKQQKIVPPSPICEGQVIKKPSQM